MIEEKELVVNNDSKLVNEGTNVELLRPKYVPSIQFTMKPFHNSSIPLTIKLWIKKNKIDINKENIEGYLKLKDINGRTQFLV